MPLFVFHGVREKVFASVPVFARSFVYKAEHHACFFLCEFFLLIFFLIHCLLPQNFGVLYAVVRRITQPKAKVH